MTVEMASTGRLTGALDGADQEGGGGDGLRWGWLPSVAGAAGAAGGLQGAFSVWAEITGPIMQECASPVTFFDTSPASSTS
jgi:hypothetical protein